MDLKAKRDEYAQQHAQLIAEVRRLTENALRLQGAMAQIDAQLAEAKAAEKKPKKRC